MASLRKTQRILSGLKLIGNFVERPLRVGDIVINDDGQHLIWANIEDVIDGFSLKGKIEKSNRADLKYTSESGVEVKFGSISDTAIAEGEVEIKFKSKNSAFVSLKQIERSSVKLGLVDKELKKYWKDHGFDKGANISKYHFISEVITAQSGTVIFSQDKSNRVVLKGKNDIPLTSLAVVGSGSVEFVINTKATLEIISETEIQPLYGAVRYRRNGNFELI